MFEKKTEPSISRDDFNCPHCGTKTHQHWHSLFAEKLEKGETPASNKTKITNQALEIINTTDDDEDLVSKVKFFQKKLENNEVFLWIEEQKYKIKNLRNCWVSECYTCNKISLWVGDKLLYPEYVFNIEPNQDLPGEVKKFFIEASKVLDISPISSAALLRLCIEKLCIHLGCDSRKNLNEMIADLVQRGLNPQVQKALDIVRVVGNNAVHAGEINTEDNKDVAIKLFGLVNFIADEMITRKNKINALFENHIPEDAKKAIDRRDAKSVKS